EGREGGEIILRARSRSGMSEAVIHVIDTGPGIDEEKRDEIFKPYFTTKRGGSGLGLPTTRRIVEAHGGRLELVSEPGRGTDFAIVLPAAG
ncbi:MAG TPA: HAMP domain-containing histidine kinase, partial [Phycisphaerales bacterium]|nr:HAMP domain-containing histidine kinase [Phycisphaerales bacterium]